MPSLGPASVCVPAVRGSRMSLMKILARVSDRARGRPSLISFMALATFLAPSSAFAQQARPYQINAGDVLEVFVWGEEKLQRDVRVLPDGTFAFPLAGTIKAEGRTAEVIGTEIRSRIQGQFRETVPEVTVTVKDTAG